MFYNKRIRALEEELKVLRIQNRDEHERLLEKIRKVCPHEKTFPMIFDRGLPGFSRLTYGAECCVCGHIKDINEEDYAKAYRQHQVAAARAVIAKYEEGKNE